MFCSLTDTSFLSIEIRLIIIQKCQVIGNRFWKDGMINNPNRTFFLENALHLIHYLYSAAIFKIRYYIPCPPILSQTVMLLSLVHLDHRMSLMKHINSSVCHKKFTQEHLNLLVRIQTELWKLYTRICIGKILSSGFI